MSKPTCINKIETRIINVTPDEIRLSKPADEKGAARFEGTAIRYNSWSEDLGGFREIIKPGSARKALKTSDVRALINHEPTPVLARIKPGRSNNTLELRETDKGVDFSFEVPDIQAARDLMISVDRGDIDQCSFSFAISDGGEEWKEVNDNSPIERTITEFKRLSDVSIVTFPAYEDTSVALRSLNEYRTAQSQDENTDNEQGGESDDNSSGECSCGCHKRETPESNDEGNNEPEFDSGKLNDMKKKLDLKEKTI